MMRRCTLALAALLLMTVPAAAHKLKVFASAEGSTISGYAYFGGDSRAMGSALRVTGADGSTVHTGVTDDQGRFSFTATRRMDHVVTVEGGDGHQASFTVTMAELPDSLPPADGAAPAPVPAMPVVAAPAGEGDLRAFIDQSVSRQIRPLREQIDAYQEKIWWHDVIGGIGYIVGVAGLAYGWSGRRVRKERP